MAIDEDLALALELADIADGVTMARHRAADLVVETKPDMTPVTESDRAVEVALRERLAVARPADAILGEEFGGDPSGPGRRWILDPIDGTKSYVRGMPTWSTLIALADGDEVNVAVVSMPALGRRWWASRGGGAFAGGPQATDGQKGAALRVSAVSELAAAQVCFSDIESWDEAGGTDGLLALLRASWRSRGLGDVWQYMLVAEGVGEAASDPVAEVWDLAAPSLIIEEAGGRFTDLGGRAGPFGGSGVASNGILHEAVLALLTESS